jgi:hypothetical protein
MRIPLLVAALLGAACPAVLCAQQVAPPQPAPATDPAPPVSSGMRVFIDPVTGRRTANPTAEQRAAAAAQDALTLGIDGHAFFTQETLPSGAVILRTHGRNQSVVLARPGAQGAVVECTDPLHAHLQRHADQASGASAASDER